MRNNLLVRLRVEISQVCVYIARAGAGGAKIVEREIDGPRDSEYNARRHNCPPPPTSRPIETSADGRDDDGGESTLSVRLRGRQCLYGRAKIISLAVRNGYMRLSYMMLGELR